MIARVLSHVFLSSSHKCHCWTAYLNLSTDTAAAHVKQFLRIMGQPIDQEALQSVLLTLEEVNRLNPPPANLNTIAGEGGAMITESSAL
jgi:hypothetical protein